MNRKFSSAQSFLIMCCVLTIGAEMLFAQEIVSQNTSDQRRYKIIEGDIIAPESFSDPQTQATWRQLRQWPGGQVPFQFHANVTLANRNAMLTAMAEWERVANVDFIPRTNENDWVEIRNDTLNAAHVGRVGGMQEIMIFNWDNRWIMCHELAHCLGYWHEQSRPDRDTYVRINLDNIIDSAGHNFDRHDDAGQYGPYDFDSVMHYRQCDFSVCPPPHCLCTIGDFVIYRPSITVLPPNESWQGRIGQRTHLSQLDTLTMSFLYAEPHWRFIDHTYQGLSTGAFLRPYKTFTPVTASHLPENSVVWIQPGQYSSAGVYTRAMTLNAPLGGVTLNP